MTLLVPLIVTIVVVRVLAVRASRRRAGPDPGWAAAMAWGMAVVFVITSITHFVEPYRSGLVAVVPRALPAPEALVTVSGVAEMLLAAGLLVPRTRTVAAAAAIAFLLAVFPANVVAAQGVDHPHAPDTPLLPRLALQLVFIGTVTVVLVSGLRRRRRAAAGP
ncbi:hypothetical protein ACH9D2_12340 [Kocuria sp. M4R2S49]|uniref:DoxX family protein n=1 Tax=Kocuria rhizosphaericola TaxID=3376284 RepID=UPI00379EF58F